MNAGARRSGPGRAFVVACLATALLNAGAQFLMQRNHLGGGIDSARSPASTDAHDYAARARFAAAGDFDAAFADAHRMPGYPLFLAALEHASDAPRRAARTMQLLLSAASALVVGLALRRAAGSRAGLAGALLVAAWVPLYHFTPLLLPESLSVFVLALLLSTLGPASARGGSRLSRGAAIAGAATAFAVLTYLKPNHLLLAAPVALFWLSAVEAPRSVRMRRVAAFLALSALLLSPWSLYASLKNGAFVPLTTASGQNLLLGAGQAPGEGLHARAARALDLAPRSREEASAIPGAPVSAVESRRLGRAARAAWAERPLATATYGLAKVLHGFGFSFRGPRDAGLALFACLAAFAAFRLRRSPSARPWLPFFYGVTAITALQMFLYLPNQRFKTILFDLPALWIMALWLGSRERRASDAGPT